MLILLSIKKILKNTNGISMFNLSIEGATGHGTAGSMHFAKA